MYPRYIRYPRYVPTLYKVPTRYVLCYPHDTYCVTHAIYPHDTSCVTHTIRIVLPTPYVLCFPRYIPTRYVLCYPHDTSCVTHVIYPVCTHAIYPRDTSFCTHVIRPTCYPRYINCSPRDIKGGAFWFTRNNLLKLNRFKPVETVKTRFKLELNRFKYDTNFSKSH